MARALAGKERLRFRYQQHFASSLTFAHIVNNVNTDAKRSDVQAGDVTR